MTQKATHECVTSGLNEDRFTSAADPGCGSWTGLQEVTLQHQKRLTTPLSAFSRASQAWVPTAGTVKSQEGSPKVLQGVRVHKYPLLSLPSSVLISLEVAPGIF